MFKQIFAKLKFSPALFEKILSFVWYLKLKINTLLGLNFADFACFRQIGEFPRNLNPQKIGLAEIHEINSP